MILNFICHSIFFLSQKLDKLGRSFDQKAKETHKAVYREMRDISHDLQVILQKAFVDLTQFVMPEFFEREGQHSQSPCNCTLKEEEETQDDASTDEASTDETSTTANIGGEDEPSREQAPYIEGEPSTDEGVYRTREPKTEEEETSSTAAKAGDREETVEEENKNAQRRQPRVRIEGGRTEQEKKEEAGQGQTEEKAGQGQTEEKDDLLTNDYQYEEDYYDDGYF